jgi:3-oxoacyl-[acyl-carrier-protein] synthase I
MKNSLSIMGFGAITPVGLTAWQTCAAIRAALSRFSETGFEHKPTIEPVIGAEVPLYPPAVRGFTFSRLVAMAAQAIRECCNNYSIDPLRTALLMGIRESYRAPEFSSWTPQSLRYAVEKELGIQFNSASLVLEGGNTAVFQGLDVARQLLNSGKVEACIVGGVDSYLNSVDLQRFGLAYRLKRQDVTQGFIPGEAAAFIVVSNRKRVQQQIAKGYIFGLGLAKEDETVTVLSDGFPTGKGMQSAFESALRDAEIGESKIQLRVSDLNGEHYRSVDSMLAVSRCYRSHRDYFATCLPASSVGEVGAAVGALMIIVAIVSMLKGYAPGTLALCDASADVGQRAACVVASLVEGASI